MSSLKNPLLDETKEAPVECLDWDEEPRAPDVEEAGDDFTDDDADGDAQGLCVSVCALLAAIPAIIGSWCWPILVGVVFSAVVSNIPGGLVELFHGIQVAIMLALMTNIVQFAYWKQRGKNNNKPIYVLMVSTVLVLVQPVCMLVIGAYGMRNFFFDHDDASDALVPNTALGWCIQIFCTYLGFALMFIGVFQVTQLHVKLKKKWQVIRRKHAANVASAR